MAVPQEELQKHLVERKPINFFLLDDRMDKLFRTALRNKTPEIVDYLCHPTILADIIDGLVNEDSRSIQEASESLQILLLEIELVLDNVVKSHLETLFNYLNREKHQPRRVYFFLRVMSFLFQNRTTETFEYVNEHPEVISKLVHHIKSPHILQLILNMLAVERQIKEFGSLNCNWSEKCGMVSKVVEVLKTDPEENLEPIHKFLCEVCLSYPSDSQFVKNILLIQDSALIKTIIDLMETKTLAADAVKLLDQVVLIIMMDNADNEEFFKTIVSQLNSRKDVFLRLLKSDSLMSALAGTKLVFSLVKHKMVALVEDGVLSTLNLMKKFKWSNVLHTVISELLCYIFTNPEAELAAQLLGQGHLIEMIMDTLNSEEAVGYKGHLRIVANAIKECPVQEVQKTAQQKEGWAEFMRTLDDLNDLNVSYRQAERKKKEVQSKQISAAEELAKASLPSYIGSPIPPHITNPTPNTFTETTTASLQTSDNVNTEPTTSTVETNSQQTTQQNSQNLSEPPTPQEIPQNDTSEQENKTPEPNSSEDQTAKQNTNTPNEGEKSSIDV